MITIPNLKNITLGKTTLALDITWDGRKRIEKTEEAVNKIHDRSTTNSAMIAECLALLKDGDYCLFWYPGANDAFIQYANLHGRVFIDVPIMFNQGESWYKKALVTHILHQRQIYEKRLFLKHIIIRGKYWYEQGYIGEGKDQIGDTIDAYFQENYALATEVGLKIFKKLFDLSINELFEVEVGSRDDSWLNQL